MRVAEILDKINIDTHLEGCWNDGGIMDEIAWDLDVWGSREILEEDGVEAFGSLNVNFEIFWIFKSFKRDLGIHIALDFLFNALEHSSSTMSLGTHIFFDLAIW